MQLSDRLSRWQWAGLGALVVIALLTLFRSTVTITQDPISVSLYTNGSVADSETSGKGSVGTSKFHLLIPSTGPHYRVCRAIASATMMGYPAPVLNGWMQEGDLDASKSHLAKVRTTLNYLNRLPESADDDLVLMIDGFDVTFQIPLDVLLERYFAVNKAANAKISARFGIDSDTLTGDDTPLQTILFGPEKVCYPVQMERVGCWAVPHDVDIPNGAFGPSDGDWAHNIPLWLNSGTIIGPARDMRRMFEATLDRIETLYNPEDEWKDSDQKYMSDVWGVQEYSRSIKELEQYFHGDVYPTDVVPNPDDGKVIPELQPDQHTEFHIGIDYRSALFQTNAGSEHYVEYLTYNATSNGTSNGTSISGRPSAWVTRDVSSGSKNFKPYRIFLPNNLVSSIMRMFRSIAHVVDDIPLISELPLQTNIVTKNVHGLFHYTGDKDHMDDVWGQMWFYPYGRELFEAALKSLNANHTISMADGRRWVHAHSIPNSSVETGSRAAGALDDDLNWLGWEKLCQVYESKLFINRTRV